VVLVVLVLVPVEQVALAVLVLLVLVAHVLQAQALVVLVLVLVLVLLAAAAEALVLVVVATIARMVSVVLHVRSHVVVVVATWTSCSRSSVPTTPQVMLQYQKVPSSSSVECRHKSSRQN
jgi:hypothetical protein